MAATTQPPLQADRQTEVVPWKAGGVKLQSLAADRVHGTRPSSGNRYVRHTPHPPLPTQLFPFVPFHVSKDIQ